jgi:hypothetical protein
MVRVVVFMVLVSLALAAAREGTNIDLEGVKLKCESGRVMNECGHNCPIATCKVEKIDD